MFFWVKFGCEDVKPHIFNMNVTTDILLLAIKNQVAREMEEFHRNKEAELQAQLDERSFQVEQAKQRLSTLNPEEEENENTDGQTKEQLESTLATYEEEQKGLEAKLKALAKGMQAFEGLEAADIDLSDSTSGNRLNMTNSLRERAQELLTQGSTYNVVKLENVPQENETEEKTVKETSLVFSLLLE